MSDRWFTLLTLLIGIFLGALVSGSVDYWKTFLYVSSDIRAHVLTFNFGGQQVVAEFALVNQGNRQGAITDVRATFPVQFPVVAGAPMGWLSQDSKFIQITGVPTVLYPGDIRIVTIRGTIHTESLHYNSPPVEASDGDEFTKPGRRKNDFAIAIRALDFKGQKYETYWRLGTMFFTTEGISSFRYGSGTDVKLFEKSALSQWVWSPREILGIPSPTPAPAASSPTPQQNSTK